MISENLWHLTLSLKSCNERSYADSKSSSLHKGCEKLQRCLSQDGLKNGRKYNRGVRCQIIDITQFGGLSWNTKPCCPAGTP